jgi:Actin maturation protease-like, C-terminal domain
MSKGKVGNMKYEWGKATKIEPLPDADHDQRGPTCGFYALAWVLTFWNLRSQEDHNLAPKVPARTHSENAKERSSTPEERKSKYDRAAQGKFSSLRHYAKYHQLTSYGAVFNAQNLVQIAQGPGSQWGGKYDGKVISTKDKDDFIKKVKSMIDQNCPVIVPFDVDDHGNPTRESGKGAHWTVVCGYKDTMSGLTFLHRQWGDFYQATAEDFANSNHQLISNAFVRVMKVEEFKGGKLKDRYWTPVTGGTAATGQKSENSKIKSLKNFGVMAQFNNPPELNVDNLNNPYKGTILAGGNVFKNLSAMSKWKTTVANFETPSLANNGLRGQIVAIYPNDFQVQMN